MMEWWNIGILGMESGKGHFLQKMLCLHFLMVPIRQLFFNFVTHNTASEQENQCKHMKEFPQKSVTKSANAAIIVRLRS